MLLGRIGLDHGTVIDPFTGSGVTGTAARRMGLAFVGLEAHPLVAELARLNLYPRVDAASVSAGADEVVAEVRALPVRTEQEAEVGMLPDAHLNEADQGGLADAVVALESGESLHIEAGNDAKPGPPAVLNLEVHQ